MSDFPLHGVIGIVANGVDEIEAAASRGLRCIEIRADLLLAAGLSVDALLATPRLARERGLASLFTLRHPDHGGCFDGDEDQRAALSHRALEQGADLIDLEWGSAAAAALLADGAPLVLSHHDFARMPDATELADLTAAMLAAAPRAIKVVPTAAGLADAVRMLQWVAAGDRRTRRIGFAMGEAGACSRILTLAFGAPVSYASFGAGVAPGQVSLGLLCDRYRAQELNGDTRVYALLGPVDDLEPALASVNAQLRDAHRNAVCVALGDDDFDTLLAQLDVLRIDGLWVAPRHAERALACADLGTHGDRPVSALTVRRDGARRLITAHATDIDALPALFVDAD